MGLIPLVEQCRPNHVTFVPDGDGQLTSDHGWDTGNLPQRLKSGIERCHAAGARAFLFLDPEPELMDGAASVGADGIELHTAMWASAVHAWKQHHPAHLPMPEDVSSLLSRYAKTAAAATAAGLAVNAGHDLSPVNIPMFDIGPIEEMSIGHELTVDGLFRGWKAAIESLIDAFSQREALPASHGS